MYNRGHARNGNRTCDFFLQGRCKFGDNCKFDHPGAQPNATNNRFSSLSEQNAGRKPTDPTPTYSINKDIMIADLKAERPQWPFSAYAPGKDAPKQLFGGAVEQSMEEMRLRFYIAQAAGKPQSAIQGEQELWTQMNQQVESVLSNPDEAIKYIMAGENERPNRRDQATAAGQAQQDQGINPFSSSAGTSAFGQSSTLGGQNTGVGGTGLGKPSNPFAGSNQSSGFGQAAQNGTSAFGQAAQSSTPAFGQAAQIGSPAFGQPSQMGAQSAFGQPSQMGAQSAFGQPSQMGAQSAFGRPSQMGAQPAFGQLSQPGNTAFGQSSHPGNTAFGQSSQPGAASAFGQSAQSSNAPAFGQSSQVGTSSAFGQASQLGQGSTFGQTSTIGQGQSAFVQPSNQNPFGATQSAAAGFGTGAASSPFGAVAQIQPGNQASAFGQAPQPGQSPFATGGQSQTASNGFGQPSRTTQAGFGASANPSPFAQAASTSGAPASAQQPAANPFGQTPQIQANTSAAVAPLSQSAGLTRPGNTSNTATPAFQSYARQSNGQLQAWHGKPVTYIDSAPHYSKSGNVTDGSSLERVWFPDGPPASNDYTNEDDNAYARLSDSIEQQYKTCAEMGRFQGGIPLLAPRRDWIRFDI